MTAVWRNGELTDTADPPREPGRGAFETLRIRDGRPLTPERHQQRLQATLGAIGVVADLPDLGPVLTALAARAGLSEAAGRVVARSGEVEIRVDPLPPSNPGPVAVIVDRGPIGVPGHKTLSYLPNLQARERARAVGADETVFVDDRGRLLEGATSNVFRVVDGRLLTPPPDGRILPGITRALVLELAVEIGIRIGDDIGPADGPGDEAFLTSRLGGIRPIARWDRIDVAAPGPVTRRLLDAVAATADPSHPAGAI